MKELTIDAKVDNLDRVLEFIDTILEENECDMKTQVQIDVCVEEIFVNIANYAYTPGEGEAVIRVEVLDPRALSITFKDKGVPYNPLAKEDPDITLSADERPIGGLGIFMVKKSADDISYEYKDDQNILTYIKKF
ncbi:MAG: ATP-binding protein [Lachnospiraceae bacterium]|nr:ATP-binding protein [Lachnospiraceae bacterium]